jgi:hypothetical protein
MIEVILKFKERSSCGLELVILLVHLELFEIYV